MAYTFDNLFAADPSNPTNVAANASILLYDPADPTKAPVTITDPTGSPIPNPVTVNKNGFGPAMQHATLDRLAWEGGGFSNFITSYEGIKNEAVSARTAAQEAAATAGADATAELEARIASGEFKGEPGADGANVLPTNDAVANAITAEGPTKTALSATYAGLVQLAKNPDTLIAGAITLDASDLVTSAAVKWPDGSPGTLTITSRDANGAVLAYNITYGSPVTKTFTQPTITRSASGAATNVPQIVVS